MKNQQGSTTAEAVLVVPIFMLIIFIIIQIGMFVHGYEVIQASAVEGAQTASISPTDDSNVSASVARFIEKRGGGDVGLTKVGITSGNFVTVTVSGMCKSILPFWSISLSASVSENVNRFRASQ